MKDSSVLKKLLLASSIALASSSSANSELQNYLTHEKNMIFNLQDRINTLETDMLHDSWISPVTLSYQETWNDQALSGSKVNTAFSIGIDQPIFKSGGIYYALKYAEVLANANRKDIQSQKRALIGQAVDIIFSIKKAKLQHRKLQLLVRNDSIDIRQKQDSYDAGILDSSFLDQAILKHNLDKSQMLDVELSIAKLRNSFKMLSRKNPDKLKTPRLKLISLKQYRKNNANVAIKRLRAMEQEYTTKMTWSKYLPTISVNARYTNTNRAAPGMKDDFSTYGFKISMPLNINSPRDIESSRVNYLKSMTEYQDSKRTVVLEYRSVKQSLHIIDKKISLAKSDESLYRNLYKRTKDLVKAGEKTENDSQIMLNSLKMKKLDRNIYYIEKQQELLKLYIKVNR